MTDRRTLSEELADLERTNPAVAAASRKYDEAVANIIGRCPTCDGPHGDEQKYYACSDPWHRSKQPSSFAKEAESDG